MSVVSLVGVHKSYGTWPVLQGVDLMVPDGARIGIIGPNGAGKSTLLKAISGTVDPIGGAIFFVHWLLLCLDPAGPVPGRAYNG